MKPNLKSLQRQIRTSLENLPDLNKIVFDLVRQIPAGRVSTYGQLADSLGDRIASKWVGQRLLNHQHDVACHCHRVIRAGGYLGSFVTRKTEDKTQLLQQDQIPVIENRIDLSRYGFNEFDSGRPLEPLRDLQTCVADEVALVDCPKTNLVAGVDLSYLGKHATASLVVFDRSKRKIVSQISTTQAVSFPYISTYLAYRELPVLLSVMDAAMKKGIEFDVIMVDGSGILHPRKAGVASFLGIATNRPTIGVIKKALIRAGVTKELEFGYPQEIELEKNVCGYAMLPTRETGKPIFISPGHLIQPQQALDTVLDCFESHRMPEPIHHADRHSRQVANGQKR